LQQRQRVRHVISLEPKRDAPLFAARLESLLPQPRRDEPCAEARAAGLDLDDGIRRITRVWVMVLRARDGEKALASTVGCALWKRRLFERLAVGQHFGCVTAFEDLLVIGTAADVRFEHRLAESRLNFRAEFLRPH